MWNLDFQEICKAFIKIRATTWEEEGILLGEKEVIGNAQHLLGTQIFVNIYFYCDCNQIPAKGLKGRMVSFGSEQTTLETHGTGGPCQCTYRQVMCEGIRGSREMGRPALIWLSTFSSLFSPDLMGWCCSQSVFSLLS